MEVSILNLVFAHNICSTPIPELKLFPSPSPMSEPLCPAHANRNLVSVPLTALHFTGPQWSKDGVTWDFLHHHFPPSPFSLLSNFSCPTLLSFPPPFPLVFFSLFNSYLIDPIFPSIYASLTISPFLLHLFHPLFSPSNTPWTVSSSSAFSHFPTPLLLFLFHVRSWETRIRCDKRLRLIITKLC